MVCACFSYAFLKGCVRCLPCIERAAIFRFRLSSQTNRIAAATRRGTGGGRLQLRGTRTQRKSSSEVRALSSGWDIWPPSGVNLGNFDSMGARAENITTYVHTTERLRGLGALSGSLREMRCANQSKEKRPLWFEATNAVSLSGLCVGWIVAGFFKLAGSEM